MNMQKRKTPKPVPASKNGATPQQEEDQPRIAWNKLSVKKSLELAEADEVSAEVQRLAIAIDSGLAAPEHMARWLELSSLNGRKQTIERRSAMFAEYVEYVPRDWFVDDVPEPIDYEDPDTYLLLQPVKFGELFAMLTFGPKQAEASTGN